MKTIKKEIGTREIQNGIEMVLKGHNAAHISNSGTEIWVTAEYFDRPKMNERNKAKRNNPCQK